jgi:hypothetical protein
MVQPSDGLLSSGFRGWGSGLQTLAAVPAQLAGMAA